MSGVARTAQEYARQLQSLLPKGKIWSRSESSILWQLLYALGDELSRVEQRGIDLIYEARIDTTSELLEEFEEDYGIPEEGQSLEPTTERRRNVVKGKIIAIGQQNKEYYEDIASELDYDITIVEHQPAWCGVVTVGSPCGDQNNIFYWHVYINIPSDPNDLIWNISQLIIDITKVKPAHTIVLFEFYGAEFSRAFSRDFNAIRHYDGSWWPGSFGREFDNSFANAYDYDGVNYIGAFSKDFSIAFDRRSGGAFSYDDFGLAFDRPI